MRSLACKPYQRPFRKPLQTAHGLWQVREGIILRVARDDGTIGYGEVAPIPDFGTETVATALEYLDRKKEQPDLAVPEALPCTRFALDVAEGLLDHAPAKSFHVAGLLPAGEGALAAVETLLAQGYTTFKWKIGVTAADDEQRVATELFRLLHERGILRLDANGGLSVDEAESWLHLLRDYPVEYLEQPLPVGDESTMASLAERYTVPIALDESLCDADALARFTQHFPHGPFIIKPSLVGAVGDFLAWRAAHPNTRVIYSSAFETAIGTEATLHLASLDPHSNEAIGCGTLDAFADDGLNWHQPAPTLASGTLSAQHCEELWKQL